MAKTSTSWKPGQSGNPKGRPARESSLVQILNKRIDRRSGPGTIKQRIADRLINEAVAGNLYAIGKIFDVVQRSYEFAIKAEIMDRIAEIERRLDEVKHDRR